MKVSLYPEVLTEGEFVGTVFDGGDCHGTQVVHLHAGKGCRETQQRSQKSHRFLTWVL